MKKLMVLISMLALILCIVPASAISTNPVDYPNATYHYHDSTSFTAVNNILDAGSANAYCIAHGGAGYEFGYGGIKYDSAGNAISGMEQYAIGYSPAITGANYYLAYLHCTGGIGDLITDFHQGGGTLYAPVNATFSISDNSLFSTKLSGVSVVLSNGQSGTTNATGMLGIAVTPPSSNYTYSLTKSGYITKPAQSLGGYGSTGGIVYDTMSVGGTGYVTTTVYLTDGSTGTPIVGGTLNLREVENNTWLNTTSTATGTLFNVTTGHTIDIYGSYPGVYTASAELGATPGGNYYLPLYMYAAAPVGSVNLFVYLREAGTGYIIKNADVNIKWGTGGASTASANTATSGTASFVVPNNTVITIESNPSGYNGQSMSLTTGTVDKQVTITLSKNTQGPGTTGTVTPTVTDPATGQPITVAPTYLPACNPNANDYDAGQCSQNQDSALMANLRTNANGILDLGIVAVIFGLLGMIMKFGK